jgi:glutathione peroxidase
MNKKTKPLFNAKRISNNMKRSIMIIALLFSMSLFAQDEKEMSFYDFRVEAIDGEAFDFSQLEGKKVMIVNTASKCGYTPQYEDLEKLYKTYGGEDFIIIGFPANNFMGQEPGTNEEIKTFCTVNYGVTFPMMAKISVKGKDMHPLYKWLTDKDLNGVMDSKVKWNFQKYLIDENGKLVDYAAPGDKPLSDEIVNWITG